MAQNDSRPYDIVVFGATGYTGSKIFEELLLSGFIENEGGSVALAGRRLDSLLEVKDRVAHETLYPGVAPQIGLIEANTAEDESLHRMARQARVCINAVGPFRFHGRQVVKACIEEGCSYLDICGEPEFIEAIELEYDDDAREKGVFVASACGFDSVPVDVGNALVRGAFPPKRCCSVETFIELHSGPSGLVLHYPTYASAVHGLGSVEKLRAIRKALRAKKTAEVEKSARPLPMRRTGSYAKEVGKYVIPFIGADASVIKRSEKASGFHPSTYVYTCLPSKLRLWQFGLYGSLFKLLAGYEFGRNLLLSYPRVFCPIVSKHGPSPDQLRETTFKVTIVGKGFLHGDDGGACQDADKAPVDTVRLEISGPEPGYLTCSICIVAAAKVLVRGELGSMPGGVYTPAGLLMTKETSFLRLVKQRGLTFNGLGD